MIKENYNIEKYLLYRKGINPKLKGFAYIAEAIKLALSDKSYILNITKKLYPRLAEENRDTTTSVERAIRTAVNSSPMPPKTNGKFIAQAYYEIKFEELIKEIKSKIRPPLSEV